NVSWLTGALEAHGYMHVPGAIVVPATKAAVPILQTITKAFGLRADSVPGKLPAGLLPIGRPRLALYKSWVANSDEGWTRWLLEQYGFPYKSISDAEVRAGSLNTEYDVIVLPSAPGWQLIAGNSADVVPAEYAGGLGVAGAAALKAFV